MKLAAYQFAPDFGDAAGNTARIAAAVRSAEADLWVLPELAVTGYLFADRAECERLAEPIPGPTTETLARLCRERNTRMAIGLAERSGDRVYNSAAILGAQGVIAVYRKIHLFDRETLVFDPGPDPFAVHPLGSCRIGLMICFDWIFPEAARSLALLGADLIVHCANLVLPWCQTAMPIRALENAVFTITANRIGTEARAGTTLTFTGASLVCDPHGRVLARAGTDTEEILTVKVDPDAARDKRVTGHNHRFDDRRPELYTLDPDLPPRAC